MTARTVDDPTLAAGAPVHRRLAMLDGWRAVSILLVLAGHMLPLGPAAWRANEAIAGNGMAIFFTLSGFLIVSILQRDNDLVAFLVRRFARIVPLAWTALAISLLIEGESAQVWLANFLFYANLPPFHLAAWSAHFWSLDLEMQFYAAIALTIAVLGRRGLLAVPLAALVVTGLRIATQSEMSIVTWLRVDEILAGGTLALIIHGDPGGRVVRMMKALPFTPVALLVLLSARADVAVLPYLRPYLTATMVGITILRPIAWLSPVLESKAAGYIAKVSYAVYILHHFTLFGWLGAGHGWEKYAKRPLAFAITFGLAHLSTFHFEKYFIDWSHNVARARGERRKRAAVTPV